ncbi:unnamed protein product [Amoebophrya sp. A25]|nr:unnamed protein product [Amoebophrya sp. A25]|eukprot:GSA25T00023874001.1
MPTLFSLRNVAGKACSRFQPYIALAIREIILEVKDEDIPDLVGPDHLQMIEEVEYDLGLQRGSLFRRPADATEPKPDQDAHEEGDDKREDMRRKMKGARRSIAKLMGSAPHGLGKSLGPGQAEPDLNAQASPQQADNLFHIRHSAEGSIRAAGPAVRVRNRAHAEALERFSNQSWQRLPSPVAVGSTFHLQPPAVVATTPNLEGNPVDSLLPPLTKSADIKKQSPAGSPGAASSPDGAEHAGLSPGGKAQVKQE